MVLDRETGNGGALVLGAGIEGMGVALLLAEAGHQVCLLDNAPWIGGSMHLLDRTFPTDSCGICLMSPVQPAYCPTLECGLHRNITLLPGAEVEALAGAPGRWEVQVREQPRYVIAERCNRCGRCIEVCPETRPDLYEGELAPQRAVFRPPSRAVPDAPLIDMSRCSRCGRCVEACPTAAIDLDMPASSRTVRVGALVLCPGYEPFDARLKGEYGYGIYKNVVTSLQFERMTSASGSTGGRIVRPSDGAAPRRVAFIHCVGSRDARCAREYCSSVCCMYTAKQVAAAKAALPDLEATVFHMDIRASGKGYQGYFDAVASLPGVVYRRSMVSAVFERQRTKDLRLTCVDEGGAPQEIDFDMVVLSVGLSPADDLRPLAARLGLELDPYGFVSLPADLDGDGAPEGVFVAGSCREPLDLPETVVDAARTAGRVARFLQAGQERPARDAAPEREAETAPGRNPREEIPRVGVFLWNGMPGGDEALDLTGLAAHARRLPGVALVRVTEGSRSDLSAAVEMALADGQINRIVVVSDDILVSRAALAEVPARFGLPAGALEWVNPWHECALVHAGFPHLKQAKAQHLVAAAVSRAAEDRLLPPPAWDLRERFDPHVLVVGAGPAGMAAALALAEQGHPVTLVEREAAPGGQLHELRSLLDGRDPARLLDMMLERIAGAEGIAVHTDTRVLGLEGRAGRFVATLERDSRTWQAQHGAVIVAAGARPAAPDGYAYGEHPDVLTQRDLERRLADGPAALEGVRRVVMVQCVGSRDEKRPYCSRVCCSQAVKNALAIKRATPQTEVHILYRDVRTPGLQELAYQEARRMGVVFLRYEPPHRPQVTVTGDGLEVRFLEAMLGEEVVLGADWLALSTGTAPAHGELARALGLPLDADGFFREVHPKMRPLDFARPGMYVCGLARGPCSLPEAIAQGEAAAMRAALFLTRGGRPPHTTLAAVNERLCSGCGLCVSECPYGARFLDDETGVARVVEALCLGCGACAAVCRNSATQQHSYEKVRMLSAIDTAVD